MRNRLARALGALLPGGVRRDAFEPAAADLEIATLSASPHAASPIRRAMRTAWSGARLTLIFLDCWRLVPSDLADRRRQRSIPGLRTPESREPLIMLQYHVRHAIRLLVREPGFTTAAVLTLALGIGANVAVFAVIEAVMLRPLPYPASEDLVILHHRDQRTGITKEYIAIGDFIDLARRQTAFEALDGYGIFDGTIFDVGEPRRVDGMVVSPSLFDTLRARPALGRSLQPDDAKPGAAPVVMLSHELWQTRFGSDPNVVGRGLRMNTTVRQIVGVAPAGFRFPPHLRPDVIVPFSTPAEAPPQRKSEWTFAVGRLKPGVTLTDAGVQFAALSQQMEREHPTQNQGSLYYPTGLRDALVGDTKWPLLLMQGAVTLVLLIACGNVANLLLVRSLGRRQEMAVRVALGAGRGRLAAQFLAETLVLSIAGGIAGVAMAYWGVPALVALVPRSVNVPGLDAVGINTGVLAFACAVSIGSAVVFGAVAAATVRRDAAAGALTTSARVGLSRATRRATSALVIVEVAIAVVLLVGAGLILRSFSALLSVEPGFDARSVLTLHVQLPPDRYRERPALEAFYRRAFESIARAPQVEQAGAAVVIPLTGNNWTVPFERSDRPVPAGERPPDVGWQLASGGYFRALGIPLRSGRVFDERDGPRGANAVIVSEAIERRFFPGEGAVGRRVRLGETDAEIVGVVGDIRRAGLTDEPRADMYFPFERNPSNQITLFVRTSSDPLFAVPAIQGAIRAIEPSAIFPETRTMDAVASESLAPTRLALWLLGVFAAVALTLAGVGVYGVMSYAVRQRTREIGTRLALGATASRIVWMIMREGGAIIAAGLTLGLVAGLLAGRSMGALLYGVPPSDPVTLAATAGVLALTTVIACYVPARRAAAVDPARTLTID